MEGLIKALLQEKRILIGTQLTREDVLKTEIRNEIYLFIRQNPGVKLNAIKRENNVGSNQALWHLKFLEKYEFIRINTFGKQKAFFCFAIPPERDEAFFFLRNRKVKDLIEFFGKTDELLTATAISDALNMHYNTAKKYLEVLERLNLLEIETNDGKSVCRFDATAHEELDTACNELIKNSIEWFLSHLNLYHGV